VVSGSTALSGAEFERKHFTYSLGIGACKNNGFENITQEGDLQWQSKS
jgi:hypothetical protein